VKNAVGLVLAQLAACAYFLPGCAAIAVHQTQLQPSVEAGETCSFPASNRRWGSFSLWLKVCLGESAYGVVSVCCPPASRLPLYLNVLAIPGGPWRRVFPPPSFIPSPRSARSRELFSRVAKGLVADCPTIAGLWCFRSWSSGPCNVAACGALRVWVALPGDQCLVVATPGLQQPTPDIPISTADEWNWAIGSPAAGLTVL